MSAMVFYFRIFLTPEQGRLPDVLCPPPSLSRGKRERKAKGTSQYSNALNVNIFFGSSSRSQYLPPRSNPIIANFLIYFGKYLQPGFNRVEWPFGIYKRSLSVSVWITNRRRSYYINTHYAFNLNFIIYNIILF